MLLWGLGRTACMGYNAFAMMSFGLSYEIGGIPYTLRASPRARNLRIAVSSGGDVEVIVPRKLPQVLAIAHAKRLVQNQSEWIRAVRRRLMRLPRVQTLGGGRVAYLTHREPARVLVSQLVAYYATRYGVAVGTISIRDQKSRWGSASRTGNLNFNYRLALLPLPLATYVVVHEVCHLLEHNHSSRFWALVERELPDFRELRTSLRGYVLR